MTRDQLNSLLAQYDHACHAVKACTAMLGGIERGQITLSGKVIATRGGCDALTGEPSYGCYMGEFMEIPMPVETARDLVLAHLSMMCGQMVKLAEQLGVEPIPIELEELKAALPKGPKRYAT